MTFSILKYLLKKFITTKSILIKFKEKDHLIDNNTDPLILKINNDKFLKKLFYAPSLVLAEGYMDNDYELPNATFYEFSELILDNYNFYLQKLSQNFLFKFFLLINPLLQLNFSKKSKDNVASHYDLSDRLYDLFLDETRQYSCAYFEKEDDSLSQAQLNKMERLSDKLSISKNDRVLDIGCGWGSLSRFMSNNYHCSVKGISLSEEQIKYCEIKKKESKNFSNLQYSLQDYRNENNTYNKIVSVGMFEHVGKKFYKAFFESMNRLLKDDGIFLLHTIGVVDKPSPPNKFINKYIFPGGVCPSFSQIIEPIEKTGLIVADTETLIRHYDKTLESWLERFLAKKNLVKDLFDEKFVKMWEFYLVSCAAAFRYRDLAVFQLQIVKNFQSAHRTRDYIYS